MFRIPKVKNIGFERLSPEAFLAQTPRRIGGASNTGNETDEMGSHLNSTFFASPAFGVEFSLGRIAPFVSRQLLPRSTVTSRRNRGIRIGVSQQILTG